MINVLFYLFRVIEILLFIRIVFSWMQIDDQNSFTRLVCTMIDPILAPIRAMIPSAMGFDLSPLILILLLNMLTRLLTGFFY